MSGQLWESLIGGLRRRKVLRRLAETGDPIYSGRGWTSPIAQQLFGKALIQTGAKDDDVPLQRLGWAIMRGVRRRR